MLTEYISHEVQQPGVQNKAWGLPTDRETQLDETNQPVKCGGPLKRASLKALEGPQTRACLKFHVHMCVYLSVLAYYRTMYCIISIH